jgi:hypothetical protein
LTTDGNLPFTEILADHGLVQTVGGQKEVRNILGGVTGDKSSVDEELNALKVVNRGDGRIWSSPTRLGLKLNFLMPSSSVVFFCLALSNLLGSSMRSGVGCRRASTLAPAESLSED